MKKLLLVFAFPLLLAGSYTIANAPKEINKVNALGKTTDGNVKLSILNSGDYIYKEDDADDEEKRTSQRFNDWLEINHPEFGHVDLTYDTTDTTETMISQLELGTTDCDLLCPSEYGVQKLINNGMLTTLSDKMSKYGLNNYNTYASKTIREYLKGIKCGKDNLEIVDDYAVGYMWGTLGIMFNPCYKTFASKGYAPIDVIRDMSEYSALWNNKYFGTILIKDSMRDTYFVGVSETYKDELVTAYDKWTNGEYSVDPTENDEIYNQTITEVFNRCEDKNMAEVKVKLDSLRSNAYGLEVDSGKQDMVVGNIGIDVAWSGDAVYSMDQADEYNAKKGYEPECGLCYSVPKYGSNVWSDCWIMPKNDHRTEDEEKAACLFLEFMCDPVIAAENMSWIGYTSYIGGDAVLEQTRDYYDIRCDLIYNYIKEDKEEPYNDIVYIDPNTSELTEVWFEDCHYKEDEDPDYNDVPLFYGHIEFDEEGNIVSELTDFTPLGETYNERLVIDPEWEEIDLTYMFEDTLSEDYDESAYLFYSDEYLPFTNADGSKNECVGRQFFTQYPDENTVKRCVVMRDFGKQNDAMRKMWEDFKGNTISTWIIVLFSVEVAAIIGGVSFILIRKSASKKLRKARREKEK